MSKPDHTYTREELMELRELGLISLDDFIKNLVIEAGDQVPEEFMGRPFQDYLDSIKEELSRVMYVPGELYQPETQGGIRLNYSPEERVMTVQLRPPISAQWIQTGVRILRTSDHEPPQTDNSTQGLASREDSEV